MDYYKQAEIASYAQHYITGRLDDESDYLETDISEILDEIFNEFCYIIDTQKCIDWLGDHVFDCINIIKVYEQETSGTVNCDFSMPNRVVNFYTYIVGESILPGIIAQVIEDQKKKNDET